MSDKFDIRDAQGRKIGSVEKQVGLYEQSQRTGAAIGTGLALTVGAMRALGELTDIKMVNNYFKSLDKHDYKDCIRCTDILISRHRKEPIPYLFRGIAYHYIKEYEKSIEDFNTSILLDNSNDSAFSWRSESYRLTGELGKALSDISAAITIKPESSEHWETRGTLFVQLGDLQKALDDFNMSLKINPGNTLVYRKRFGCYLTMNEIEKAISDCNRIVQLEPRNPDAYIFRAHIYKHIGNKQLAEQDEKQAAELMVLAKHNEEKKREKKKEQDKIRKIKDLQTHALLSLILGLICSIGTLAPPIMFISIGNFLFLASIGAIVIGYQALSGLKSNKVQERTKMAKIGITLGILNLVTACMFIVVTVYLHYQKT